MVGAKWTGTVVAAVAWAGLACAQPAGTAAAPTGESPRFVTVQELGKPAQRCRVLKTWREPDGMVAFEVQSISTGERLTLRESGPATERPGSRPGSRLQLMPTSIYHWTYGAAPVGAPVAPGNVASVAPPRNQAPAVSPATGTTHYQTTPRTGYSPYGVVSQPSQAKPADKSADASGTTTTGRKVEPAQPSDWRKSWGKTNEHAGRPVPKVDLPHADATRPDPLKDPVNYTRKPLATTTSEIKKDATPAKDGKDTHAADPSPLQPSALRVAVQGTQTAPAGSSPTVTPMPARTGTAAPTQTQPPAQGMAAQPNGTNGTNGTCECPKHQDPYQIVRNSKTLVDVFRRLACNPPRECGEPIEFVAPARGGFPRPPKASCECQPCACPPHNGQPCGPCGPCVAGKFTPPSRLAVAKMLVAPKPSNVPPAKMMATVKPGNVPPAKMAAAPKTTTMPPATEAPMTGLGSVMAAGPDVPALVPMPMITVPPLTRQPGMQPPPAPPAPPMPSKAEVENAFTTLVPATPAGPNGSPEVSPEAGNAFVVMPDDTQAPVPPNAMGAAVMPQGTYFPGYSPNAYAGRGTPAPTGAALAVPAMPQPPMPAAVATVRTSRPAAPAVDVSQMLSTLKDSLYPSHREWAADNLATTDLRQHPEVVDILLKAAHDDPAATVRCGCVRTLGKLNANSPRVVEALRELKSDKAPQVGEEVDHVLARFTAAGPK